MAEVNSVSAASARVVPLDAWCVAWMARGIAGADPRVLVPRRSTDALGRTNEVNVEHTSGASRKIGEIMTEEIKKGSIEWMRAHLISRLNDDARKVRQQYSAARNECIEAAGIKQWLSQQIEILGVTQQEACIDLQIVHDEVKKPDKTNDVELIDQAVEFVNANYADGKYTGREAESFVRKMLKRIDPELLLKYDER